MDKLPDFFWSDRLEPVNFYGYTSSVRERFFEIEDIHTADPAIVQRFHDLKRKCMSMCVDMARSSDTEPVWSKDIWDNKIVIECKTEKGATIFVGFHDFTYSIGLSWDSIDGREPRAYRGVINPVAELSA